MSLSLFGSSHADLVVWEINATGDLAGTITFDTDTGFVGPGLTADYIGVPFSGGGIVDFSFTGFGLTWETNDGPGPFSVTFGASTDPGDLTSVDIFVQDFGGFDSNGGVILTISGGGNGALSINVGMAAIPNTGFSVVGIPEPASATLLMAGCLTGFAIRRRRKA